MRQSALAASSQINGEGEQCKDWRADPAIQDHDKLENSADRNPADCWGAAQQERT